MKTKILLAMSGGVDSSVAALLLKKQGYEIIGAFMKNWSDTKDPLTGECNWRSERTQAIKIASILNIPLITLDFEKQYKSQVVDEMFKKYKLGITPNPDVDCNNKVKFPLLWKAAKKLNCDLIATGHYACIKEIKNKIELHRAKDESKDQSYFIYRLKEFDLSHTLFPIGNYTKKQIREIAEKNKFPNYNKKSTVGICFIGKVNLKNFLKNKIKPKKGNILNPEGRIIGTHDGIYYYTIGQRIGPRFGININKGIYDSNPSQMSRWYVAKKDVKTNTLTAAPEGHKILLRRNIIIKDAHWINNELSKTKSHKVFSRIRQVGELIPSILKYNSKSKKWNVTLNKAITGISEGQAVVLYQKTKCIGGGVISF
ncbi:MAG: tRNA 2-thiouridine(34) synthase MnmA [Nanoarchaeota archaeon]|nr:tRNA 2-thiouridine(34) synthase MnmA [Nanoarchaeota archaeon]